VLLLPPQRQSTLQHEFLLTSTRISDNHLSFTDHGKTRSKQFVSKSFDNPLLAILITPRLFPQKILEIKVYKTSSISPITAVILSYKKEQEILTESFCSPILGSTSSSNQNACKSACACITRNVMDELR
jgi:hypothetical protein